MLIRKLTYEIDMEQVLEQVPESERQYVAEYFGEMKISITESHENIEINPVLHDWEFEFSVPDEAKLVSRFKPPGVDRPEASKLINQPAPGFELMDIEGKKVKLADLKGKVVLIDFWATWCGPCRQEMPLLDDLFNRYERVGFTLLGVNIDDDSQRAIDMMRELGVNFPVLFDATKDVSKLYNVNAMPVTVILDREGNVRHVHQGYKPGYEEKYLNEVRALLRE
jgi:peroxiredoxin